MAAPKNTRTILGVVLLALGGTCNAVGIGLTVEPRDGHGIDAGVFWIVFSIGAMIVPGVLLVLGARKQARRAEQLAKITALATASQRLPIAVLAEDLQVSVVQARDLLLAAISARLVIGRLDLEHGVFVSGSTHGGVQQVTMTCGSCGARSSVIVSVGSPSTCPYCAFRMA
ncbi:MAG: hypothetical protein IAG13_26625 [Deltaproteobacteria bacterium]|nr:hypothetical protein [Nannocystaceae bacterium]